MNKPTTESKSALEKRYGVGGSEMRDLFQAMVGCLVTRRASPADAEDVAQGALCAILQSHDSWPELWSQFQFNAIYAARMDLIDLQRKRARRRTHSDEQSLSALPSCDQEPVEISDVAERRDCVERLFQAVPSDLHALAREWKNDGTDAELARTLSMTIAQLQASKRRLERALEKALRDMKIPVDKLLGQGR